MDKQQKFNLSRLLRASATSGFKPMSNLFSIAASLMNGEDVTKLISTIASATPAQIEKKGWLKDILSQFVLQHNNGGVATLAKLGLSIFWINENASKIQKKLEVDQKDFLYPLLVVSALRQDKSDCIDLVTDDMLVQDVDGNQRIDWASLLQTVVHENLLQLSPDQEEKMLKLLSTLMEKYYDYNFNN